MVKQLQWAWKRKENKAMFSKRFEKETFKETVKDNVRALYRKTIEEATPQQIFQAVSYAVKDVIFDDWFATQKAYDEKIVKAAEKSLCRIRMLIKEYETDQIEQVYLKLHPERKKLIEPVEKTWDQRLEAWLSEEYQGKAFQEGTVMIRTEKGERVRSKSEKILADYFYRNGIPYKYERPLYLKGLGVVHPDFTILSRRSGQEIFWEHNGRMDDPVYAQNAVRKIQAYMENDIYPGESLILTFETEKTVLDDRMVKGIVERFL